ncbi:phosphate acyltransferase PlsX [Candidatus Erwinia haradaeae]|uniref:Phosphate acyltransferase n=1 Tax=Candidatus Erwinia haradaeae TaxID=1922217 RepID=A0A451DAA6_9GAMM|nr:phosphate acyltransferase PlsX [Candidatus Erwinia haradaeae]VFP83268.1 Phosphate acyltransferase [Candidatus Erwinia haradaeae]
MNHLTVAIDAMGGDFGPRITVPASLQALASNPHLHILLVGDPHPILSLLSHTDNMLQKRLKIIGVDSIVPHHNTNKPILQKKRSSSMRKTLEQVQIGKACACVSAGNTSEMVRLAKLLLKPLSGIQRPALMTMLPNQQKRKTVFLDIGANIHADTALLVQFAVMGSIVAKDLLGISYPRVALINIGTEINKGSKSIQEAAKMLKKSISINFVGYLEANDLLSGNTDVLICDGFVGNITLKTMEGVLKMLLSNFQPLKTAKEKNWGHRLLTRFFHKYLTIKFSELHPDQYNGACLLGFHNTVIKSHGSANQRAFIAAIQQAEQAVRQETPERISACLKGVLLPKSD